MTMAEPLSRPELARRDETLHDCFEQSISDPYRWLEQSEDPAVQAWVGAQSRWSRRALDAIPYRAALRGRLEELYRIGEIGAPVICRSQHGGALAFYSRRSALQPQPSIWLRDESCGEQREVFALDARAVAEGAALDWFHPAPSGRYLAYGVSRHGDEDSVLRIRDCASGQDLGERIARARFCSVAWLPGEDSFLYTRYPRAGEVPAEQEWCHRAVYLHRLGRDPAEDERVWQGGATDFPSVQVSPDGSFVLLQVYRGWDRNDVYLARHARQLEWIPIVRDHAAIFDARFGPNGLFVRTSLDAPRYCVLRVALGDSPELDPKPVVEQRDDVLQGFVVTSDHLVLHYLNDASSRIDCVTHAGIACGSVSWDAVGTCRSLSGSPRHSHAYYDWHSFCRPPAILALDPAACSSSLWQAPEGSPLVPVVDVARKHAVSADGTRIPMFVVRKRGTATAGPAPALLIGYGGFNVSMTPKFERASCTFIEHGGVLVVANLRGGGEFGQDWYRAGCRENKSRVVDDILACAEELQRSGITDREHLALLGESHSSLIASAAVTRRPELFRAAVCAAPLTDMLRFHLHGVGRLWTAEFGSPEEPEHFRWLHAYSPYHAVRSGVHYPAMLYLCGEHDARTHPMHARKMVAALQHATPHAEHPILLLSLANAGHGFGKALDDQVAEMLDIYAFLFAQLGMTPRPAEGGR
jgi:prolyl oligopeptidase